MIYQPGNKVKIQNLKQDPGMYDKPGIGLSPDMIDLSNEIATIEDVDYDDDIEEHIYRINLDNRCFTWVAQYFCPPKLLKRKSI